METLGYVILIVGAVLIGLAAHYLVMQHVGFGWALPAVGAAIGGFVASEYTLGGLGAWGTQVAGMYIFPALIGALLLAAIVESVIYFSTERSRV